MTFVTKVSKEGYDVKSTGNVNLTFNAANATHSIFNIISASILNGLNSVTITHGLDFVPKVWIYLVGVDGDGTYYSRIPRMSDNTYSVDYYITSSTVVIQRDTTTTRLDFKVIIFTRSPQP